MNKTIIVNIAGAIFHIDEEAYDILKEYNNALRNYFAKHKDGHEIVSDIESRIAELFTERLKAGAREVVEEQDVKEVIHRLGSVEDFSFEEDDDEYESVHAENEEKGEKKDKYLEPVRLYRNVKNEKLGGVCAGLGDYMNIDPTWIRLIWVVLTCIYGIGLLVYLVLWIVVPAAPLSYYLSVEEQQKTKNRRRLYRDPRQRMIGGVCAGFATYFNTDPTWIRLIWVLLFLLFGFGLVLYIIFWIIMPKAKTLADQMAMKGEPDTLDGIVRNAEDKKKNLTGTSESAAAHLINNIFMVIIKSIKFIFSVIGKLFGLLFALIPFGFIIAVVIAATWVISGNNWPFTDIRFLSESYTIIGSISLAILCIVPALSLLFLGIRIIAGRPFVKNITLMIIWIVWFAALICSAFITGDTVREFQTEVAMEEREPITLPKNNTLYVTATPPRETGERIHINHIDSAKKVFVRHNYFNNSHRYQSAHLELRVSPDSEARLIKVYSARGKNIEEAGKNVQSIIYQFSQQDSLLTLNRYFRMEEGSVWRDHQINLILELPVSSCVELDWSVTNMLWRTPYDYKHRYSRQTNRWEFTTEGVKHIVPEINE